MFDKNSILNSLSDIKKRLRNLTVSDREFIEENHEKVFRRKFTRTGCGDCYGDAAIKIYNYLTKNNVMEKKSKYTLKAGVIIMPKSNPKVFNNHNLTDDISEAFLKENKKSINLFASYPDDWEKRIKKEKKEEEIQPIENIEQIKIVKKALKDEI